MIRTGNYLAESVFGGVAALLEVFGWVGLAHASAVSDLQRNESSSCLVMKKKDIENKEVRSGTAINSYLITQLTAPDFKNNKI